LQAEAAQQNITDETLKKAKRALGVNHFKRGFGKDAVTYWGFEKPNVSTDEASEEVVAKEELNQYNPRVMSEVLPDTYTTDKSVGGNDELIQMISSLLSDVERGRRAQEKINKIKNALEIPIHDGSPTPNVASQSF